MPRIVDFLGYTPQDLFKAKGFGEKLRVYRQLHGLTQKKLAEKAGVDPGTIMNWENRNHKASKRTREKIFSTLPEIAENATTEEI